MQATPGRRPVPKPTEKMQPPARPGARPPTGVQRPTTGVQRPAPGRPTSGALRRPTSASMQRVPGRGAPIPPKKNKKKVMLIACGGGAFLMLIIIAVAASNAGDKKKQGANKPTTENTTPTLPTGPTTPPKPVEPEEKKLPPNMEAVKVERTALEGRTKTWEDTYWTPLNGDVLSIKPEGEKELRAICDAWETFVDKLRQTDFSHSETRILKQVQQEWQTCREHQDQIAAARKKAGQPKSP